MFRKARLITAMFLMPVLLVSVAGTRPADAAPATQAGPQKWTIMNGQAITTTEGEKPAWQALKFYTEEITIAAGDTITWKHNSLQEPHNVVFLGPQTTIPEDPMVEPPAGGQGEPRLAVNPLLLFPQGGNTYDGTAYTGSGFMAVGLPGPMEYSLTFPKAGTYTYLCSIHSGQLPDGTIVGMVGKVTVMAAGSALPMTPAQVQAEATSQMEADVQKAKQLEPQAKQSTMSSTAGPNGTTVYHVMSGYVDRQAKLEYQRFIDEDITINVGDTVEWTSASFHTVTFGEEPELVQFEPQPQGPPKVYYNPMAYAPIGGPVHQGNGYYNSAFLVEGPLPPGAPPILADKYSLTFSQPGRYEYICIPHYQLGMDGTITVRTSGGQPGMPRTGGSMIEMLWALSALAALALGISGFALRRHRARG
ncbi:MAG TPA: plastocyanin/azurin family copper-binding protein [Chloroflexia bacterium]|jgi:plastocyanin